MDIEVIACEDTTTIKLAGNLTVATAPKLEQAFKELSGDVTDVVLDLEDLEYIASAGLRVIVSAEKQLKDLGGGIRLVNLNEEVSEVFEVTGLVEILAIEL